MTELLFPGGAEDQALITGRVGYGKANDGHTYPLKVDNNGVASWMFGQPTLMAQGNGSAHWARGTNVLSTHQKGSTGWVAQLNGGVQSAWDDAAEVYIPVNEMPLTDLTVGTTMWSYFMTDTEIAGVGMVVWVHDPNDFDKRAEISMLAEVGHVELSAGWNAHELAAGNDCVWYGENTGTHGTTVTAGTAYNFSQFLADDVFSTYTIYRISFAYGFQTGNSVFDDVYLADVKINGEIIPLGPKSGKHKKTVVVQKTMLASAKTADEVISESTGSGTDWDFDFGGTGYITKAIVTHDAAITPKVALLLFSIPPTGVVDDEGANDNPNTADTPYYVGRIDFPAMSYNGTGDASSICTPSTAGNLPIEFDTPLLYGVLIAVDTTTTVAEALTIALSADMEDN